MGIDERKQEEGKKKEKTLSTKRTTKKTIKKKRKFLDLKVSINNYFQTLIIVICRFDQIEFI